MVVAYTTPALSVFEVTGETAQSEVSNLVTFVPALLSPAVVENLPLNFQGIRSDADAQVWFEQMVSESRFFVVKLNEANSIIGFVFAFIENDRDAHIGYLLGEAYWGQGLASELLRGFIRHASEKESWEKLIGGVDRSNQASSKLLLKLNFVEQSGSEGPVIFYEYLFPGSQS